MLRLLAALMILIFGVSPVYSDACTYLDGRAKIDCLQAEIDRIKGLKGLVDDAVSWLRKKQAEDPDGTESALRECRGGSTTYGELLNCMHNKLGD